MRSGHARALLWTGFASLAVLTARPAPAQDVTCDPGELEVRRLEFNGNAAFTDAELARLIVTTPSAWARRYLHLPLSARRCIDRAELPNDRLRILAYYRRRGFPDARVDTAIVPAGTRAVAVRFDISEGAAVRVRSIVVSGLDGLPAERAIVRNLPVRAGARFDRVLLEAARDSIVRRLRDSGYPRATATNVFALDTVARVADDTIRVTPGPFARIGRVEVTVVPYEAKRQQVPEPVVRRILALDSGRVYRESELLNAQRTLYSTEVYQHVAIGTDTAIAADSSITLRVLLVENTMRAARLGAGYGTLDCFRLTGELSNYNFLRRARRLDVTARVSKIGVGEPLGGVSGVCPPAKRDPFSAKLNYYAGVTLRQPAFSRWRAFPTVTVLSERVSEYNAYLRTTAIGGIATVDWRRFRSVPVTFGYSMDLGRTEAQPALFCAVFNLCDREDRERVQQTQRNGVLSIVMSRDRSDDIFSPTRGFQWRVEGRHASAFTLSDADIQFNKLLAERSHYWKVTSGSVLAFRLRGGAVFGRTFGSGTGFIPQQERLYAGGPTSVRGFPQNELGSAIYIAREYEVVYPGVSGLPDTVFRVPDSTRAYRRAVPVGGNSMVVSNLEMRMRSPFVPELLQWTVFADAGDVWNRGRLGSFQNFSLKVTPGLQLTAFTPVGPVRVVAGYNPYSRPSGPLYYEVPRGEPGDRLGAEAGALPCVSPGNALPVDRVPETNVLVQRVGRCPGSFTPRQDETLRSRLTFALAIGQAF